MTENYYRADLFGIAHRNDDFRQVLATTDHTQLVVMTIPPGGEVGEEVHDGIDQILIALDGTGEAVLDGRPEPLPPGWVVVVPSGTKHNVVNSGSGPLRLITAYGPPEHPPGTVHHTKADADADPHDQPH